MTDSSVDDFDHFIVDPAPPTGLRRLSRMDNDGCPAATPLSRFLTPHPVGLVHLALDCTS